ncbi:MAG: radical SAM protein [Candidatus Aminicenantes bacterium]|nr:MAG: radical SAM protein [Candidatus Aminicenantes bacterium]
MKELENCQLCEHRCQVNRLKGETGVCRMTTPVIASAQLHPAPPESYTVFLAGCNYKCLNCQNWSISQYPDNNMTLRGYLEPGKLAKECINQLYSPFGKLMGADRIFFSGGEATIHLPYIEKVVEEARKIKPEVKVNFDTNGYMTEESLKRVLRFTTSITYDLKAYHDEVHLALTGASAKPVLRNAEYIGKYAKDKLWEYRILVIPGINEEEIKPLTDFVAGIDPALPVCFLAFRPNFVLEHHPGADEGLMNRCVDIAEASGLQAAHWAGQTGIAGKISTPSDSTAGSYARQAGCLTLPRNCSTCPSNQRCPVKRYIPPRVT